MKNFLTPLSALAVSLREMKGLSLFSGFLAKTIQEIATLRAGLNFICRFR